MTNEQLRQNADAMNAFADGKKVQWKCFDKDIWTTCEGTLSWNCEEYEYRRAPEPVTRPWNRETLPELPFEVRHNVTGNRLTVVLANEDHINLGAVGENISYARLLEVFTRPDGSICGIKE